MGRVEILPEIGFPPRYHQFTRGVCNNIGDILVKLRWSGVKVRFLTPFGRESAIYNQAPTAEPFGVAFVCFVKLYKT